MSARRRGSWLCVAIESHIGGDAAIDRPGVGRRNLELGCWGNKAKVGAAGLCCTQGAPHDWISPHGGPFGYHKELGRLSVKVHLTCASSLAWLHQGSEVHLTSRAGDTITGAESCWFKYHPAAGGGPKPYLPF